MSFLGCSVACLMQNGHTFAYLASLATLDVECETKIFLKSDTIAQDAIKGEQSEVEVDLLHHR